MFFQVLGIILAAAAVGAIIYLGVRLTISVLRNRRKQRNSNFLIYDSQILWEHLPDKEKHKISASALESGGCSQVATEFDPVTGMAIQSFALDQGMDERIEEAVEEHDGYIIVEDL